MTQSFHGRPLAAGATTARHWAAKYVDATVSSRHIYQTKEAVDLVPGSAASVVSYLGSDAPVRAVSAAGGWRGTPTLAALLRGEAALTGPDSPQIPTSGYTVPADSGRAFPPRGFGTIWLDCRDMPLLGWWPFRPRILLDGQQVPGRWGINTLSLPAGQHHVEVFVGAGGSGRAATFVTVYPGQVVWLEYKTPAARFSAGSLGPPPQRRNGTWALWLPLSLLLGLAALTLLCIATGLANSH